MRQYPCGDFSESRIPSDVLIRDPENILPDPGNGISSNEAETTVDKFTPKGFLHKVNIQRDSYLAPVSNFPYRAGTKVTAGRGRGFGLYITFAPISTTLHAA